MVPPRSTQHSSQLQEFFPIVALEPAQAKFPLHELAPIDSPS